MTSTTLKDRVIDAILESGDQGISARDIAEKLGVTVEQATGAANKLDRQAFGLAVAGWGPSARWCAHEHLHAVTQAAKDRVAAAKKARDRVRSLVRSARKSDALTPSGERILAAVLAAGPQGLALSQVVKLCDVHEQTAATCLAAIKRLGYGLRRVGNTSRARWVAEKHADALAAAIARDVAEKARAGYRGVGVRDEALQPRRPRHIAGTLPPPKTSAPRSIFEWRPA